MAIAAKARTSCSGVTATPWPKAWLARSIGCHGVTDGSVTRPADSLPISIPVFWPMPRLCHMSYRTDEASSGVLPSIAATLAVATLRELAMTSSKGMMPMLFLSKFWTIVVAEDELLLVLDRASSE